VIVRAVPDAGRTPSVAFTSDDPRHFEIAFRQVSRSAFLLARQLGRSTEEAQDIVQEAALRGWRYRSTRTGDFRPWFLSIVYRLSRRRMPAWVPLPVGWDPPAPDSLRSELDPDLLAALRRLPSRQRAALWLRYIDDLAVADVAGVIGCSETAAKQLLLRGRDALRTRLASHLQEESS
jgi:DNA-directed RNA polymerase specialized sigma24 family protein